MSGGGAGWFCDQGGFWGTAKVLYLCAKCGKHETKRHDELRHYAGLFTPHMYMICDACYDGMPDTLPPPSAGEAG